VSRQGGTGDNHFFSARLRDLQPLLDEGTDQLELDSEKSDLMESYLEEAWFSGTRNGHAKLLNHAERCRRDPSLAHPSKIALDPSQMSNIEGEFKILMESSAEALNLTALRTIQLWEYLSRAWIAGVHTYESELMAHLIEQESDVTEEALRWLEGDSQND
jgi:hypothetical protein